MTELPDLSGRQILLGVSAGVAAYKSAELCRLFVRCGANVSVMMTEGAQHFVGEATFAALSGNAVATNLFDPQQEASIGHIRLADRCELLVFAPATADLIAKLAHGIADNLVSTVHLACRSPVILAPAMNVHMWQHPATRRNVDLLGERGYVFVGPEVGEMACGHVGAGRMAEASAILREAAACLAPADLAGRRFLITAGPTREPIDAVRFIGNRSSGRMGYAVAASAARRGAAVTLISGPTELNPPEGVSVVRVGTAAEMAEGVQAQAQEQDAVIMAAAVADYRPREVVSKKIKKSDAGSVVQLDLEQTEDVLAGLGRWRDTRAEGSRGSLRPLLVGFAAEAVDSAAELDRLCQDKLTRKRCDLLVANNILEQDAGFGVQTNRVVFYDRGGRRGQLPLMSKREVARRLLDEVASMLDATAPAAGEA